VDYARFERLVIGIGAAAIVGTAALSLGPATDPVEFVAQLLLLAVLVAAVRWGRRGGTTAAIVATVAYVAVKVLVGAAVNAPAVVAEAVVLRALMYVLVGVAGGEACMRMKLLLTRAHDARAIDESSSVYTPQFLSRVLGEAVAGFERYKLVFSVLVISVDGRVTAGMNAAQTAETVRSMAARLRTGLRLVDEIGRLPWGAFAIILPQTGASGAQTAADRLRADLRDRLAVDDAAVTVRVLTATDDLEAIRALAEESAQSDGPRA